MRPHSPSDSGLQRAVCGSSGQKIGPSALPRGLPAGPGNRLFRIKTAARIQFRKAYQIEIAGMFESSEVLETL